MIVSIFLGVLVFSLGLFGLLRDRESLFAYQYLVQMMVAAVFLLAVGGHYLPLEAGRVYSLVLLPVFVAQLAVGILFLVARRYKEHTGDSHGIELFKW